MKRRELLSQLSIVVAGTVYLPSCEFTREDVLVAYTKLNISTAEIDLIKRINAVIIPSDPVIKGASDLALEDFVLVVVNDCFEVEKRDRFVRGLTSFQAYGKEMSAKKFESLSAEESKGLILRILDREENKEDEGGDDAKFFLETTKELLIQGFMRSEYVMTEIMPYDMAPGGFSGKVKILPGEKINIYG